MKYLEPLVVIYHYAQNAKKTYLFTRYALNVSVYNASQHDKINGHLNNQLFDSLSN